MNDSLKILLITLLVSITIILIALVYWFYIIPMLDVLPPAPQEETQPSWSPDGKQLVYTCYIDGPTTGQSQIDIDLSPEVSSEYPWAQYLAEAADICIVDINSGIQKRLINEQGGDWYPLWSPGSTQIAYLRQDGIYLIDADGRNRRQLLAVSHIIEDRIAWSSDGQHLLFSACFDQLDRDIYLVNVNTGRVENLTPHSDRDDIEPSWIMGEEKIFFLSVKVPYKENCLIDRSRGSYQMKYIDSSGGEPQNIYQELLFYPNIATSTQSEIIFISNLISTNESTYPGILYQMTIQNPEPIRVLQFKTQNLLSEEDILASWSPDGKHLVYKSAKWKTFQTLNLETEVLSLIPTIEALSEETAVQERYINRTREVSGWPQDRFLTTWSSDGKQVAITAHINKGGSYGYAERHIFLYNPDDETIFPVVETTIPNSQ